MARYIHLFLIVLAGSLVTACQEQEYDALEQVTVKSSLLATLKRADGTQIPSITDEIQKKYGFRAQTMNFVVPSLFLQLTSALSENSPAKFKADTVVSEWNTKAQEVINDALALPFDFTVSGNPSEECPDKDECRFWQHIDDYAKFFANTVAKGLQANLELRILGQDNSGNAVVKSLSPYLIEYDCAVDSTKVQDEGAYSHSNYNLKDALFCSGKVEFRLEE